MTQKVFVFITFFCFTHVLIGLFKFITNSEENKCHMTYMFESPKYVPIKIKQAKNPYQYGLYAYSEGSLVKEVKLMKFSGFPVIFIPGNRGSFKQARSLASTALRKGMDLNYTKYIDYFTVNFNEEFSGLYGGYLYKQREFLKECITTVLNLYGIQKQKISKVALIGHSMGGKLAESLISDVKFEKLISIIIAIASPINKPPLYFDYLFKEFYKKTNKKPHRNSEKAINFCHEQQVHFLELNTSNIFFITIGGGSRDKLLNEGLAYATNSDINVLTTAIPTVRISTDHLATVWCLQLVLTINRFLYSTLSENQMYENAWKKKDLLSKSLEFFTRPHLKIQSLRTTNLTSIDCSGHWVEDSRRSYELQFPNGLNKTRFQMILLSNSSSNQMLAIQAIGVKYKNWLLGCSALTVKDNFCCCEKQLSLTYLAEKLPPPYLDRQLVYLELHKLKKTYKSLTHLVLKLQPSSNSMSLYIDIHQSSERIFVLNKPNWNFFSTPLTLAQTNGKTTFHRILLAGLEKSYEAIDIYIIPNRCGNKNYLVISRVCIPWIKGCESFHFTTNQHSPLKIFTSMSKPTYYSSTDNIEVDVFMEPGCIYTLTYQMSFGDTMSRIVQQYYYLFISNLFALIFLAFGHQSLGMSSSKISSFVCCDLNLHLLKTSTLFFEMDALTMLLTDSNPESSLSYFDKEMENGHQTINYLTNYKFNYDKESKPIICITAINMLELILADSIYEISFFVSFIIYTSSIALLILINMLLNLTIHTIGIFLQTLMKRLTCILPALHLSSAIIYFRKILPISVTSVLIVISVYTCGGVSMIVAVLILFLYLLRLYVNILSKTTINLKNQLIELCQLENKVSDKGKNHALNYKLYEFSEENDFRRNKYLAESKGNCRNVLWIYNEEIRFRFYKILFLLLLFIATFNLPLSISWAQNIKLPGGFSPDSSFIPSLIVLGSLSFIWQYNTTDNLNGYTLMSLTFYAMAIVCKLFCREEIYRLNVIVYFAFIVIALNQLTAYCNIVVKSKKQS